MSYLEGGLRRQPTMTAAIYLGELVFAVGLAIVLLATSTFASSLATLLFCCGVAAWTVAEYLTHRFVLHAISPVGHRLHHARPQDGVDKIFWQIWLPFFLVLLAFDRSVFA